ncbi:hypothetical protein BKA67DRAFT_575675 [Truncatella angustata]|uniref:Uncharacterized protein n=1 Tax=Truncatella angustata TaxID=152316 RepID=A0A9P8ZVG5_9PEZI|nr:uncharacterized protein BKA67DRAFT_575675 [Truncatella angustata]KAH6648744.1 hypothetical protein BKA67DRAFT_575675 [Truncatella angustata]
MISAVLSTYRLSGCREILIRYGLGVPFLWPPAQTGFFRGSTWFNDRRFTVYPKPNFHKQEIQSRWMH